MAKRIELFFQQTAEGVPQDTVFARFRSGMVVQCGYIGHDPTWPFNAIMVWHDLQPEDQQFILQELFKIRGKRRVCIPQKPPKWFHREQMEDALRRQQSGDTLPSNQIWVPSDFAT